MDSWPYVLQNVWECDSPRWRGRVIPLRGASVRRPSPPLPRCYLSPQQPQTGTGRRIPWCASIERPQRHCGVQEVLLKKNQSNYKGRTNCYKVIISWEKNPVKSVNSKTFLAEVTLSVIRILKPKVSVAYAYWQRTNSIIMKTYTNIMNEKKMFSFEYIDACLSIDYAMKNM